MAGGTLIKPGGGIAIGPQGGRVVKGSGACGCCGTQPGNCPICLPGPVPSQWNLLVAGLQGQPPGCIPDPTCFQGHRVAWEGVVPEGLYILKQSPVPCRWLTDDFPMPGQRFGWNGSACVLNQTYTAGRFVLDYALGFGTNKVYSLRLDGLTVTLGYEQLWSAYSVILLTCPTSIPFDGAVCPCSEPGPKLGGQPICSGIAQVFL